MATLDYTWVLCLAGLYKLREITQYSKYVFHVLK